MLILYDFDSYAILIEPIKSKSGSHILADYKRAIALLTPYDNKASPALQHFAPSFDVDTNSYYRTSAAAYCRKSHSNALVLVQVYVSTTLIRGKERRANALASNHSIQIRSDVDNGRIFAASPMLSPTYHSRIHPCGRVYEHTNWHRRCIFMY
jgi:hypothetical protein